MAPKDTERYVKRVGREILTLERRLNDLIRAELVAAFSVIREILLRELPDDGLARSLAYAALRPRLEDALIPLNDSLSTLLAIELWSFQRRARELAAKWLGDAAGPDLSPAQLMRRIRWFRHRLDAYFLRRSPSVFMKEILRLVDRTVQRGILQGTPTAEIVAEILPEMTRGGRRTLVIRRGTVINAVRARVDAQIATAIWQTFTRESQAVWQEAIDDDNWVWEWSAILDPKTCPICAPLDGQRRRKPSDFPVKPQVHPNCRCTLLPVAAG